MGLDRIANKLKTVGKKAFLKTHLASMLSIACEAVFDSCWSPEAR